MKYAFSVYVAEGWVLYEEGQKKMWVTYLVYVPHPEQFHSGPQFASPSLSKSELYNYWVTLLTRRQSPPSLEPPARVGCSGVSPLPLGLLKPTLIQ